MKSQLKERFKGKLVLLPSLFALAIIFESCSKSGAWEYAEYNYTQAEASRYFTTANKHAGRVTYSCDNGRAKTTTYESRNNVFFEGMDCADLGYKKKATESDVVWGDFINEAGVYTPGANGKWGTSAGTSGSGNCSLSNYKGPTADVQSASFCQSAYVYKCSGNSAGVKSSCATYNQFRAVNTKLPECSYCN